MADITITAANVTVPAGTTTIDGIAGEAIAAGETCYLNTTTNKWMRADNNAGTVEARRTRAMAINGAALNQPIRVAVPSAQNVPARISVGAVLTNGVSYFQSANPGKICPAIDVVAGMYPCFLGIADGTSTLVFNPTYSTTPI